MPIQGKNILFGLAIGLLGVIANMLPTGTALEEHYGLGWLFDWRGPVPAPTDVIVVALDQESANRLGLSRKPDQWPRSLHAQLVRKLANAGASAIAFDLTFETAGQVPPHDDELAAAIRSAGNVVLVESLAREEIPLTNAAGTVVGSASIEKRLVSIPILEQAAMGRAPFPLPKESRVNASWLFKPGAGASPVLSVVMLQVHTLAAYDQFIELLRKIDPALAASLPQNRQAVARLNRMENLVLQLRSLFSDHPQLAKRMRHDLENNRDIDPKRKAMLRAMLDLYLGDDVHYLNFYGPARHIKTVPYHQALETDAFRADDLKGKAVFIGYSAMSLDEQDRIRDNYHTVFSQSSGVYVSGVEIAATAFANLLEHKSVQPLPSPWSLCLIFTWGCILALACRRLQPVKASIMMVAATAAYAAIALHLFSAQQIWLPLIAPILLQAPLALFGGALLSYLDARTAHADMRRAFSQFIPQSMVDKITRNAGKISAANQMVYGICLATDAEKYTSLAEGMDPVVLAELMNEYYAVLFQPVEAYGGVVSDVIGDAMLAIWTVPPTDLAMRNKACRSALDIIEAVCGFNRCADTRPALRTRISLHYGPMMLGTIGAKQHYEYRAVGDIVNTATRLLVVNKHLGTSIVVSEETMNGLENFVARPLGTFLLAGKSQPVNAFELMCEHSHQEHQEHMWLRDAFSAALDLYHTQQWQAAAARFCDILKARHDDGPARFYLAQCEAHTANPPSGDWSPVIRIDEK